MDFYLNRTSRLQKSKIPLSNLCCQYLRWDYCYVCYHTSYSIHDCSKGNFRQKSICHFILHYFNRFHHTAVCFLPETSNLFPSYRCCYQLCWHWIQCYRVRISRLGLESFQKKEKQFMIFYLYF